MALDYNGVEKVISGGQTGADQTALKCAKDIGLKTGGTAPLGFQTSTGKSLALRWLYGLNELECHKQTPLPAQYACRSMRNVDNSDGSMAFRTHKSPGTDNTISYCQRKVWGKPDLISNLPSSYKPVFIVHPILLTGKFSDKFHSLIWESEVERAKEFLQKHQIRTLNVFGHRAKFNDDTFEQKVYEFLKEALNPQSKQTSLLDECIGRSMSSSSEGTVLHSLC